MEIIISFCEVIKEVLQIIIFITTLITFFQSQKQIKLDRKKAIRKRKKATSRKK